MAIPDFQTIMSPLLKLLSDGKERILKESIMELADTMNLTSAEAAELLPSGRQKRFNNRVAWASIYLKTAGLLESTKRGHYRITQRGKDVVKLNPPVVNIAFLNQFSEFAEWRRKTSDSEEPAKAIIDDRTPDDAIAAAFSTLRQKVAAEILEQIRKCSPKFFEQLVIDLLVKMGYGGSREDVNKALVVGKSGDGGVDGIINEDRLGLDVIYVQAKRWENTIGRPQIQGFVGALHGRGSKGVFITTSSFSRDAEEYARSLAGVKIVLIDGEKLADLMIEHDVGVSPKETYVIKKIDYDYFSEEE